MIETSSKIEINQTAKPSNPEGLAVF